MPRLSYAGSLSLALLAATGCSSGRPGGEGAGPDSGVTADAAPLTTGIRTLAGSSEAAFADGDRATGRFSDPVNVAWGPDGILYVADFDNNRIRAVTADGTTTTVIDDPHFQRPYGLVFAQDGSLIVSTDNDQTGTGHDSMSGTVWKVDIAAKSATVVANAVGRPRGLAVMGDGRIAMTDEFHHVIRTLDLATGTIAALAGTWDAAGMVDAVGAAARFSTPYGIATRPDGSVVVADFDNSRIRAVAMDGTVTTLAGTTAGFADGAITTAQFAHPQALALGANGDLFVTDMDNHRVRKLAGGAVTTVAGNGTAGWVDADTAAASELYGMEGLALDKPGTVLYIADGNRGEAVPYNRIRQVKL